MVVRPGGPVGAAAKARWQSLTCLRRAGAATRRPAAGRLAAAPKAGCPARYPALVIVALADDVGASLDQHPADLELGGLGGEVQRIGVVALVANVNVGVAPLELCP